MSIPNPYVVVPSDVAIAALQEQYRLRAAREHVTTPQALALVPRARVRISSS